MRNATRTFLGGFLAATLSLGALPAATAQAEDPAGEKPAAGGSSQTAADLEKAHQALTSDLKATREGEKLTVTYTNNTDAPQKCAGMALPYSQVIAKDLENKKGLEQLSTIKTILAESDSAVFGFEGWNEKKVIYEGKENAAKQGSFLQTSIITNGFNFRYNGIAPGASESWEMAKPTEPAVAVMICGSALSPTTTQGIEPAVLFAQVDDKLGAQGSTVNGSSQNPNTVGSVVNALPGLAKFLRFFGGGGSSESKPDAAPAQG